ncbi:type II toxin-antitoxin system VapC family toxin [Defluviicoccus vanus]|uniref:Type II toxin-antitoxin system VapC family toxin n=1 Tax=Defluviicoccus vanus TaxID=111831 RepID=A0A7H1N386_9PROT|nr:type II toxin-antitoxin system VapC family toxin [Defluviicoccus vanus]QNT70172.1 type II toxin-antitoxin system VapC family toxin [Defluviicoccus vanus]
MPFVLDASVTLSWVFDDEDHPFASQAMERIRADAAFVPAIWWFEVRNSLIVSERRGRLSAADSAAFLRALSRLPVSVDLNSP